MGTYVTGDCHGRFDKIFNFINRQQLNEQDNIIVLGDMGLFWQKNKKDATDFINNYENQCRTNLYFIDGNHENFDLLEEYKIEDGIRKISPHIAHLPRGTVHIFDGKKCLMFGGADSVDKTLRTEKISWWAQERIDIEEVYKICNKYRNEYFDYIFTHACPLSILQDYRPYLCTPILVSEGSIDHTSEICLEYIKQNLKFSDWWFGHYHTDSLLLENKFRCLFNDFRRI